MYSADGYYIGCKEVPRWHTYIPLPTGFLIILISILLGIGVIVALNVMSSFENRPSISITNDLPF